MGMADTMKAFPKKSAEDLAERLRLKSCRSRSSSDCCLEPPLGAMAEPEPRACRSGQTRSRQRPPAPPPRPPNPFATRQRCVQRRDLARHGAGLPRIGQSSAVPQASPRDWASDKTSGFLTCHVISRILGHSHHCPHNR